MKLYLVALSYPYEGGNVYGVYESRELAEELVRSKIEEYPGDEKYIFLKEIETNQELDITL